MEGGCKSCRQWAEHFYWEHFEQTRMRFFTILMGDFSQRMRIPRKFMQHFKEELSEFVNLKGPSGLTWHVGPTKIAGNVFLQHGWKEFVDVHHLKENDLLVFKYDGDSSFTVLMFDSSGCEKESSYLFKKKFSRKRETKEDSVEILDVSSRKVHNVSSSINPQDDMPQQPSLSISYKFPRGNKAQMSGSSGGIRDSTEQKVQFPNGVKYHDSAAAETHTVEEPSYTKYFRSRRQPVTDAEKDTALQLALSFRPVRPAFLTVMKESNVYKGFHLWITPEFAKKYLPHRKQKIILRLPSGKNEWEVSYLYSSFRFVGNWKSFSVDNNLEEGDVCIFELTGDKKHTTMTVHIFRVVKEVVPLIPTA